MLEGDRGSDVIYINGAVRCLVHAGGTIIDFGYADYSRFELADCEPTIVHVDRSNVIVSIDDAVGQLVTAVGPRRSWQK